MAMMKLQGAQRVADSFKAMGQPENLRAMAFSGVIIAGTAVACAAWIGGSLVNARESIGTTMDKAAVTAGFGLEGEIEVRGVGDARAAEVRAVAMSEGRASLFSATPVAVKRRVESLPWVQSVTVRREWPSRLSIDVKRRPAYALAKTNGALSVVDANGAAVGGVTPYDGLPLMVGSTRGASAHDILLSLEDMPQVRTRMDALVRVGDRRWDMKMKSGAVVALPTSGETQALRTLEALQEKYSLLDRPLSRIDLRAEGRVAVLPRDILAGGPGLVSQDETLSASAPGA
jgi:cell division protein FtsQ